MSFDRLRRAYLTADPRSLGFGRIVLALVLLLDLGKRAVELSTWYSNQGLLPNHTLLWRPTYDPTFSLFYAASWPEEAAVGFLICAAAYLLLLVGYRTRLAQIASFICVLSLHGRLLFIQNGGDVVLSELAFWTMFLPTGRRYSLDSLLARLRRHPDRDAADLTRRDASPPASTPVVSLGVLALIVQIALIYFLNAIHKTGITWHEGTVVHYVLHQDRIVTLIGLWVRGWLPVWGSQAFTWSALAMEWVLPVLILSPWGTAWTRRLAVLVAIALHMGFALFLNLGIFVPAMIAFALHLLPGEAFTALERRWARRPRRRVVVFDGDCGFCFWVVRALARIDRAGHLTFVSNDDRTQLPSGLDDKLLDATIAVVDPQTDRRWTRADAFAEICLALPGGFPVAIFLRLPIIKQLAGLAYDAIAVRRTRISMALGLAACGIAPPPTSAAGTAARIPLWNRLPEHASRLRELLVAVAILVAASQVVVENAMVRRLVNIPQPAGFHYAVNYLQLFQGWFMFAPDAPLTDMTIYVDAVTRDGRHVDPYNEVASPPHPHPGPSLPAYLGQNSFHCDYLSRIPFRGEYQQAFREWVLRYPERTGRRQDGIVSFEAFVVEDDSPKPGESQPTNLRVRRFLQHP